MSNHVKDLDRDIDEYDEPPTPNMTSDEEGDGGNQGQTNRAGVVEDDAPPAQMGLVVEDPNEPLWHDHDQPSTLTEIDLRTITRLARIRLPIQILHINNQAHRVPGINSMAFG